LDAFDGQRSALAVKISAQDDNIDYFYVGWIEQSSTTDG